MPYNQYYQYAQMAPINPIYNHMAGHKGEQDQAQYAQ